MRTQIRSIVEPKVLKKFQEALEEEKMKKGLGGFASSHEISGVIDEEHDEMKQAVHENNVHKLGEELMDIMIAAFWGLCSIEEGTLDW